MKSKTCVGVDTNSSNDDWGGFISYHMHLLLVLFYLVSLLVPSLSLCLFMASKSYPVALVVNVEIKRDRLVEFLKVIEEDAIGSRERENGGCLRFDVHRDQTDETKFIFYEVYKDDAAIEFHKNTEHFKLWTNFKESGGVVSVSFIKTDAIFFG